VCPLDALKIMNATKLLPRTFDDLYSRSIYHHLSTQATFSLFPVFSRESFDSDCEGNLRYYRYTLDGSMEVGDKKSGEFLRVIREDGSSIYLHFSQVFQPSGEERFRITTQTTFLGVTLQLFCRHRAIVIDLCHQLAMLNQQMVALNGIYDALMTFNGNYEENQRENAVNSASYSILERMLASSVPLPRDFFSIGMSPRLYVAQSSEYVKGKYRHRFQWFFIGPDEEGNASRIIVHEAEVWTGILSSIPAVPEFMEKDYLDFLNNYFSDPASAMYTKCEDGMKFTVGNYLFGKSSIIYWRTAFDGDGKAVYTDNWSDFFDESNAPCTVYENIEKWLTAPSIEVIGAKKSFFLSKHQVKVLLDTVRICIDDKSTDTSLFLAMLKSRVNDVNEDFVTATNCLSAIHKMAEMNARNIR
jgi:hypothetical protein